MLASTATPTTPQPETIGYVIEPEAMTKLRKLQDHLHMGTDRERDYGHQLWLILNAAEPLKQGDLK